MPHQWFGSNNPPPFPVPTSFCRLAREIFIRSTEPGLPSGHVICRGGSVFLGHVVFLPDADTSPGERPLIFPRKDILLDLVLRRFKKWV